MIVSRQRLVFYNRQGDKVRKEQWLASRRRRGGEACLYISGVDGVIAAAKCMELTRMASRGGGAANKLLLGRRVGRQKKATKQEEAPNQKAGPGASAIR